MVPTLTPTV